MRRLFKRLRLKEFRNSGQGSLEYVLFLGLNVVMILGMVYQFNTAFHMWVKTYFGDYISCLIETGELPSLGSKSTLKSDQCSQYAVQFSLKEGKSFIRGEGIAFQGQSEDLSDSKNEKNAKGASRKDSRSDNATQSTPASSGATTENETELNSLSRRRRGLQEGKTDAKKISSKSKKKKDDDSGLNTLKVKNNQSRSERIPMSEGEGFYFDEFLEEEEERKRKKKAPFLKSNIEKKETTGSRTKPIPIKRKKQIRDIETKIETLSFGKFFRYLIIAGIVIALFVLIGGQFLQIKESL